MEVLIPVAVLLIAFILCSILIFFVFRELILWYWRINEAVDAIIETKNSIKVIRQFCDNEAQSKSAKYTEK